MTEGPAQRPYGLWDSPITPLSLARMNSLTEVNWAGDGSLIWLERRGGRGVLVIQPPDGQAPREFSSQYAARGRLGYGGGEFTAGKEHLYFAEADSGRLYRQALGRGPARPILPPFGSAAAPALSPDGRWVVYVHSSAGEDSLAIVDAGGKRWPQKLVSGEDFYMQPAWHPDGSRLAWIAWNNPDMPWDGTWLRMADLAWDGNGLPSLGDPRTLAGRAGEVSVFQPAFSPDGRYLAYVSDETGWWQIYLHDLQTGEHRMLTSAEAEHGVPAWMQGRRTCGFNPSGERIYFLRIQDARVGLWSVEVPGGEERKLDLGPEYSALEQIAVAPRPDRAGGDRIALIASGDRVPQRVITYETTDGSVRIQARATAEDVPADYYAASEPAEWTGMDGGRVYGLFYAPHNPHFESSGKPPLIVLVHGGPTGQRLADFDEEAQFFTSRGYAVLDVNYRGSSGYGRAYRNMLRANWGVYDVQDTVSGARALADRGRVDGDRMVIMGGSSGGLTVLKALEDYSGTFKAGVSRYPVSDFFSLAADTHKFEAHYADSMVGPLPEAAELYRERSPINYVDRIRDALAIFQGGEDQVVPIGQTEALIAALRRLGVPHEYHVYPEEGHGFRRPETIEHYYQSVLDFLRRYVLYA